MSIRGYTTLAQSLAIGIALMLCGCGESSPSPDVPDAREPQAAGSPAGGAQAAGAQATGAQALGDQAAERQAQTLVPEGGAEVAQPFESLEGAVASQATAQTSAQNVSAPPSRPAQAPQADPQPAAQPPLNTAIAAPTAEQQQRWAVVRDEPLQLLRCRDGGGAGFLTGIAVVGDGSRYALAGSRLTAWSLDREELEHDFSDPANEQLIKSFAASPDGKWLVSGDAKGNLQIWDLPECKQRFAKKIYPSGVAHISISTDSQEFATSSYTGEITIWDPVQLMPKSTLMVADQALQRILYAAPDRIVIAAQDTTLWNTRTGQLEHTLSSGGYESTLALTPDGQRLVYSDDSKLHLWNLQDSKVDSTLAGSFSNSDLVDFSGDGKRLVTASKFLIQVWDVSSGQLLQVIDSFGWQTVGVRWLPKSSLLMIASENGRVRMWGTAAAAAALGWQPLHAAVELPSAESSKPACPAQLLHAIDIRSFPKLPGAILRVLSDTSVDYSAPVKIEEAKVFYEHFLTRDGWSRSTPAVAAPDSAVYRKQGFGLSLYMSVNADGTTQINLNSSGNVDLRSLPKFDAAPTELVFENEDSVLYRTQADLLDIETTLLRKFHAAGWTSYAQLNSSRNEEAESRGLQFIQGATTLLVTIQRPPVAPSSHHVTYGKYLTSKALPIPKDAGFVEFDGSTEPHLVASTAMTLEQTRDHYDKEMAAQGWLRRDSGKQFKEKSGWMEFIRGQCDATLVFECLPTARTQIRIGKGLENSSWQLKKIEEVSSQVVGDGLEAADFPGLNGWAISKFDAEGSQIDFVAKDATTMAVGDAYTQELQSRGWKTDGSGIKSDEYLLARFVKGKAELTLRATLAGKMVNASISGEGLLWSKPLPIAPQVISYEAWLRIHRHPASLELLDQYTAEMKEIAAAKSSALSPVPN